MVLSGGPGEAESTRTAALAPDSALVIIGLDTVRVEVADEYSERVKGLQDRTDLPDGTGMLFLWDVPGRQSFWMRNTPLDLDVAFVDEDGRIVKLATMDAGNTETVGSGVPVTMALEVRAGWFRERGVREGDTVRVVFDDG